MYKMFSEGELHFIELVDPEEELQYDGFIWNKKIETILEVSDRTNICRKRKNNVTWNIMRS